MGIPELPEGLEGGQRRRVTERGHEFNDETVQGVGGDMVQRDVKRAKSWQA